MKIEMLCTGEEVLSGQIVDTNSAWFGDILMEHGFEIDRKTTVGDRFDDLVAILTERSTQCDVILVNGGLGPTEDDLSAKACAQACSVELREYPEWTERLHEMFEQLGRALPPNNIKQSFLPEGSVLVDNPVGTACGFRIKLNRAWLFFTPGVPREFFTMVQEQFLPFIKTEAQHYQPCVVEKLLTFGYGESPLAQLLEGIECPEGINIAYRASAPHVEIKLIARGDNQQAALQKLKQQVIEAIGDAYIADDASTLAQHVHQLMLDGAHSLAIAESCTGGMIAEALVNFAGSSNYLSHGAVTYSNLAKMNMLNVNGDTLANYGAVSIETALEMARGTQAICQSDYGLSTTGVAGPTGGSEDKPLGTLCIGLVTPTGEYAAQVKFAWRSRGIMRKMSTALALNMLTNALTDKTIITARPSYQIIKQVSRTFGEQ